MEVWETRALVRRGLLRDHRGGVALLGFGAMTSILGMAGFAIGLGTAYLQQARLQKVADSAAMAGAMSWVKTGSAAAATATIKAVVLANGFPASVILAKAPVLAQSPRNSAYPAIQVRLTAPPPLTFLRAITAATSVTTTVYAAVEAGTAPPERIPMLYNTGVNDKGAVPGSLTSGDPHYGLISVPFLGSLNIQINPAMGTPSNWSTSQVNLSAWIQPTPVLFFIVLGTYKYQPSFDLTDYDPATVSISGQLVGDDQVSIQLNGSTVIGTAATGSLAAVFTLKSGFIRGNNVLLFNVTNTGGSTGLQIAMTSTASSGGGQPALVQ